MNLDQFRQPSELNKERDRIRKAREEGRKICEVEGHDFQVEDFSPDQVDVRCTRCGKLQK